MTKYLIAFLFLMVAHLGFSTHIKAGEILTKRDATNPLKYKFTLVMYYETDRITTSNENNKVDVSFLSNVKVGDNNAYSVGISERIDLANNITKATYEFEYTYSAPSIYWVSFDEQNRIAGIKNMSGSVNTAFSVAAIIIIDPSIGLNESAILTIPPIDEGAVGTVYTHSPGAYDPDGDSLAFSLVSSQKSAGIDVDGYKSPADNSFGGISENGGPATISIDPRSGLLTWDAPGEEGVYNIAIRVNEYRYGVSIGYVTRDMQIIIKENPNKPPVIKLEKFFCLTAGVPFSTPVTATDPDRGDRISLTPQGSVFTLPKDPATFSIRTPNPQASPVSGTIRWTPSCDQVRNQYYNATVKAEDNRVFKLSSIKVQNLKVLAPVLKINKPLISTNDVKFTWEPYTICANRQGSIKVYRTSCDSAYTNSVCADGDFIPSGYKEVASIPLTSTSYTDLDIVKGTVYYYVFIAKFNEPTFGRSEPTKPAIVFIGIDANKPTILNINVLNSDKTNGRVKINWLKPFNTGTAEMAYRVWRSTTLNGTFAPISDYIKMNTAIDSSFIDEKLNTLENQYFYQIEYYHSSNPTINFFSDKASTLFLKVVAGNHSASLSWSIKEASAITKFEIYNAKTNQLLKTTSDTMAVFENLRNCDTVSYRIVVNGQICNFVSRVQTKNTSNDAYTAPKGGEPGLLSIKSLTNLCAKYPCPTVFPSPLYTDTLTWNSQLPLDCKTKVAYKVYFGTSDDNMNFLTETTDTFYIHSSREDYQGCYAISSTLLIDGVFKEGAKSTVVCKESCPCIELPNVVTVTNDGFNDIFKPFREPRFVKNIKFKVFNRWGTPIYSSSDSSISWKADDVAEGVYYYEAIIEAQNGKTSSKPQTLKGWIHVIK